MAAIIKAFKNAEDVEKIIRYYSKKDANPENTKRFVEELKLGQESDPYKGVFKAFKEESKKDDEESFYKLENEKRKDDTALYYLIKGYIGARKGEKDTDLTKETTERLEFLQGIKEDELDELLCKDKDIPSQKWHFLVSWYAYKKLTNKNKTLCDGTKTTVSPSFNYFYCKELIIWLAEVIIKDKPEFQTTFNRIYNEAKNDAEAGIKWSCKQAVAIEFLDEIFNTVLSITDNNVN